MIRSVQCIPMSARAFMRSSIAASSSTTTHPPRRWKRSSGRLTRGPLRFSQKADCQITYVAVSRRGDGVTDHIRAGLGDEAVRRRRPVNDTGNFGQGHDEAHQCFALNVSVDRQYTGFWAHHAGLPHEVGRQPRLSPAGESILAAARKLGLALSAEDLIDMRPPTSVPEDVQ